MKRCERAIKSRQLQREGRQQRERGRRKELAQDPRPAIDAETLAERQLRHALKRGFVRFGLTPEQHEEAVQVMRAGHGIPLEPSKGRFGVKVGGRLLRCVFDPRTQEIVTWLPSI